MLNMGPQRICFTLASKVTQHSHEVRVVSLEQAIALLRTCRTLLGMVSK